MKWPTYLALIRHDVSAYNKLKLVRQKSADYQNFLELYKTHPECSKTKTIAQELGDIYKLGKGDSETR